MDPLTEGLALANTLARLDELYVLGLTPEQRAARSTRLFDLIERVLALADKAHDAIHAMVH